MYSEGGRKGKIDPQAKGVLFLLSLLRITIVLIILLRSKLLVCQGKIRFVVMNHCVW